MSIESRRPLEGVKCVCITMFQQGPYAFAMMADLGAEVIKIEPPGTGELGRQLLKRPDFPVGGYFETNNRGVRDITLNIQTKEGIEILKKLVKDADIFAQNFRPGVAERRGFSYEDLAKVNPRLVYLSMSAYGPDGPDASLPGTDGVAQAMGGIASVYGEEGAPMFPGQVSVGDQTGAIINFGAALVGLYHARMTGEGQKIDTSLLGGQICLMGHSMTRYLWHGDVPPRIRARVIPGALPTLTGAFSDMNNKPFLLQGIRQDDFKPVMTALGCYQKLADAGCSDLTEASKSGAKQQLVIDILDKHFASDTRENWVKLLRANDVVSSPINNFPEAASDPNVIANKYIVEVDHPRLGKIKENGFPYKFSKTPPKAGTAPLLGEHTVPILKSLGYSDAQIEEFRKAGVI